MAYFGGLGGFGHSKPYKGDALAALGLGVANFVNGIVIRHPFIVLHRQCQVHDYAIRKHLGPTTLVPVIFKLAAKDGPLALWKGAVGSGVLWAFSRCSELIIAELFGLPKTYVPDGSSEKYWRHLWLKASNFIFCTPVIVASFVETVRSGANLTEDLQILEVITRGFERLYQEIFGGTAVVDGLRRRHSLLWLALPTSFYQVIHFLICRYVYGKSFAWMRAYVSRKMPSERKRYHTIMPELFSTMTSVFIADIACYPLETVLHRLYIQGTRTLVDNLDQGTGAFVPAGRYAGVFDCFTTITTKEGISALYSGVGALILQYMLQHCVASLVYWALDRGGRGYTSGPMTIKTAEYPSMQTTASTSAFNPFPSTPSANNMDPQFATSSQQTSASILITDQPASSSSSLFPTFAETQQRSFNSGGSAGKQADNNPFFAALRQKKSGAGFTTQEYSNTTSSNTASPSLT